MGVFDSAFSQALKDTSANNTAETPNQYESGEFAPDFGINQNDFKDSSKMENINDGQGGSLIAQAGYNRTSTEQPQTASHEESVTEMASRIALSAGAGFLSGYALTMAGLRHIPKIGTPLALAAPFLVAGCASSYQKTESLTDLRSFAEGALAYGAVCGFKYVGRAIEAPAHYPALGYPKTISTPIKLLR